MLGRQDRSQGTLFIPGNISDFIPEDHILKRVSKVLTLAWLRDEVVDCYCLDNGRPGIDPEAALRLMLAGFFHGIVHDRKLMREAQVNLAIRWFAGYPLDKQLPDHSSLTRIRQRWGADRFRRIFQKIVKQCIDAGLVSGDTVHVDATLVRADVSWESLATGHAEKVIAENAEPPQPEPPDEEPKPQTNSTPTQPNGQSEPARGRPRTKPEKPKKRSTTDPDATMATSQKNYHLEPTYKQHTAVHDKAGIIVDVELTTGEQNEGALLPQTIQRIEAATGKKIEHVTADASYAHAANYQHLESRGTQAIIPPQREIKNPKKIPARRFKYDAKHHVVRCPGGKLLQRSFRADNRWYYRSRSSDCRACPLRERCFSRTACARLIAVMDGYEALLRARRHRYRWDDATKRRYSRHRHQVEGVHGEAKTQHGLRRAVRRGLANVAIQVYLTACVINLKRLATLFFAILRLCRGTFAARKRTVDPTVRFDRVLSSCRLHSAASACAASVLFEGGFFNGPTGPR